MMSPRVFKEGGFVFWFHSYDVLHESRANIHVGKGSQNDAGDAKIWLERKIEVARPGRTLNRTEFNEVIKVIERNFDCCRRPGMTTKWYDIPCPAQHDYLGPGQMLHP